MKSNKRIEKVYSLSPMQSGMFFHAQMNEKSRAYFQQAVFKIKGDIDRDLLQDSFYRVIARYDILRTVFRSDRLDRPMQFVLKQRKFRLGYEDISHMKEGDARQYLEKFAAKDREKGFDLTRDMLMRVNLYKTGPGDYTLIWSFHHILMDGWCLGIIYQDVARIYQSLQQGKPVRLDPVFPYANYIGWLEKQDRNRGHQYWEKYLEGYEGQAGLPKLSNHSSPDYCLEEHNLELAENEIAALKDAAAKNRVTLNVLFQTLWGILLQKYTNSDDVVFGIVAAGRPPRIKGIEKIVGLFINTVPLRVESQPGQSFAQLLKRIHENTAPAKNFEYLSLADIQAGTRLKENLIDHIMAYENLPYQEEIKKTGEEREGQPGFPFQVREVAQHNQTNYDLNLIIIPFRPFIVKFNYNTRVYDPRFIRRLGTHLQEIIKQVKENPAIPVNKIEIITAQEKQRVLYEYNRTAANYPGDKTIHELYMEQTEKTPDHIALIESPGKEQMNHTAYISYRRLNKESNRLAGLLTGRGVQPDVIVGIMAERSAAMIAGILAILKAGGAYLPIDPDYPEDRKQYMLKDSSAKILLTRREVTNLSTPEALLNLSEGHSFTNDQCPMTNDQLAYIIYTSGTTGRPKGVMINHRNVVRLMVNDRFQFDFNNNDIWTLFHSFCFDFSVWEMYGALLNGGKLVIIPKKVARETGVYLEILKKQQVTVLNQTPSAFYALSRLELSNSQKELRLRWVIFGGEALGPAKLEEWKAKYPATKLINMYGITETTVHVTYKEILDREIAAGISGIGKPIPTLRVYIIDRHGNFQPIGIAGELCVAGAGAARGYLNRPALTAIRFNRDLWDNRHNREEKQTPPGKRLYRSHKTYTLYHSGDLARWLEDGDLEYLGRIDQQVQIRGFRIEPGEIENRLTRHEEIKEAVVLTREDKNGDKYLCAYTVTGNEISPAKLKEYLLRYLPEYMVPSYFIGVEEIPLTANGKLDESALPEPGIKPGKDQRPPRDEIEKQLADLWSEVLGIEKEKISIDGNFFEMGGHSLKATILIAKIHQALEVEIPLAELFIKPTIIELAGYIRASAREKYFSIPAVEAREYYPLSSAQERLYLLQSMDRDSTAYNIPAAFIPAESIERNQLETIFNRLIKRHESLRTSFHMIEGQPVQRIRDEAVLEIEYYQDEVEEEEQTTDNRGQRTDDREQTTESKPANLSSVIRHLSSEFIRPFDLSQAPLIRAGLITGENQNRILIVDMHHIVTDGTSMGLLIKDITALYRDETLPGLRLQYKDYSQWQERQGKSQRVKQQENHWLKRYSGEIPVLELPVDKPRPAIQDFAGSAVTFTIGRHETRALKELALQEGVSLFMVLLAVFNVFLAKISGREQIVVGTPTSGRGHADLQKIMGMFVNTLPLVNRPLGRRTFVEFLRELGKQTMEDFANQDYQFEDLVDKVVKDRDPGRGPLFDVMLALQEMETAAVTAGLQLTPYPLEISTVKFDLTFNGVENSGEIHFVVEYRTTLYRKETIQRWIGYFNRITASILAQREIRLGDIVIITEQERWKILYEFNKTSVDYPRDKTVLSLLASQADKTPDNIVVIAPCPGGETGRYGQITYRDLQEKSRQTAHLLRTSGVGPGAIVGIQLERSIEMVIGIIGIMEAGGAYLPISPEEPQERVQYMLKDSAAEILLTSDAINRVPTSKHLSFHPSTLPPFYPSNPSNLAYVIYTSGTTGKPKGVLVEHRGLFNLINWIKMKFKLGVDDNALQLYSFSFDGFIRNFLAPLVSGARQMIPGDGQANDVFFIKKALTVWRVTHFVTTPSLCAAIMEVCTPGDLAGLWGIGMGGEELKPSLVEKIKQLAPWLEVFDEYGPTEITILCTINREIQPGPVIPIGKPVANTKIYILDPENHLAPVGIAGELYVAGAGVARGYLNQPTLTAEKFDQDLWDYQDYHDEEVPFGRVLNAFGERQAHKLHELPPIGTTTNKKFLRGGPGGALF